MSSETGGGGGGGAPRMCVECNVRVAQAIVAVDNARRLCCMECVARLKAERKSRGQKPNNNNAAAAAAAVAAANANNGANGVANGAVNATNAVPDDKLCQRCRVNVRQAKVVLRGESILACGECVRALSSQAKEAKEKEKSDAAAAAAAAVPAPGAPAAAPAAAPSAEDKAKLCEKCGLRPRKAKIVVNKTQVLFACKPCALEYQALANGIKSNPPLAASTPAAATAPVPVPMPSPLSASAPMPAGDAPANSMREDGPLPVPPPIMPPDDADDEEDDSSATLYQPLEPIPAPVITPVSLNNRAALINSVGPPPPAPDDEEDPAPPAPDFDSAQPLPPPVTAAPPAAPVVAAAAVAVVANDPPPPVQPLSQLPRPMQRGESLAPPPLNLAASLPPPVETESSREQQVSPKHQPPVMSPVVSPRGPPPARTNQPPPLQLAARQPQAAPISKPTTAPPTAQPLSPGRKLAAAVDGGNVDGMLSDLQNAMKRDAERRAEQRKKLEEKVVADRVVRQSRRATNANAVPFSLPPPSSDIGPDGEPMSSRRDDNSLALLWEECEAVAVNDDERAMMLDERSKLVAELCATERTFATMVKQALRIYFDPLLSNRSPAALAPVQRCLADIDSDGHVLALVGALQLIAKSSERLASKMDEMKTALAKARGDAADDDDVHLSDAPIGKLLLRDSEQLFELCSALCVKQLPDGARILRTCESTGNAVATFHTEQRNKSFVLRDYPPLRSVALPAERLTQWCALLRELVRCTPPDHADYNDTADMAGLLDAQLQNDSVDPLEVYSTVTAKVSSTPNLSILPVHSAVAKPAPAPQPTGPMPFGLPHTGARAQPAPEPVLQQPAQPMMFGVPGAIHQQPAQQVSAAPQPMMVQPQQPLQPIQPIQPQQPQQPQQPPELAAEGAAPRRPRGVALMPGMQLEELGAQRARLQKQAPPAGPPAVVAAPPTRGPPPMRRGPEPTRDAPPPIIAAASQRGPPPGPGRPGAAMAAPFVQPPSSPPPQALHQSPVRNGPPMPAFGGGFPPERPTSPDLPSPTTTAPPPPMAAANGSGAPISSVAVAIEPGRRSCAAR